MPAGAENDARAFYGDLLGFEEVAKPPELAARGGVWLRAGDVKLHLGMDPDFTPAKKAHPAFGCAAYEDLLERLKAHGIPVTQDPLPFEGKAHCYVHDPFGTRIEFIQDEH